MFVCIIYTARMFIHRPLFHRYRAKHGATVCEDEKSMPIAGLEEYPLEKQLYRSWTRQVERQKAAALQCARGVAPEHRSDARDRKNPC